MLAWFTMDETAAPGQADRLVEDVAHALQARGLRLAGAVQRNLEIGPDSPCDMDMIVIGDEGAPIRISQSLGPGASGCRLDTGALEQAVARAAPHLRGADIVVVPKFGRQEAIGRGFRSLIGEAAAAGLPVVLYVPRQQRDAFLDFAGELAVQVAPADLAEWCLSRFADAP